MKWQGRAGSTNIEDRRGMRMGIPIGGGIGGLVLLLLFSALTGQNPLDYISTSAPDDSAGTTGPGGPAADDPQRQFIGVVLRDTEETWGEIFRERGATYQAPTLVLFTDATQSGCGVGQSAMGPFYCPVDGKVYLDLSFFQDLSDRFQAPGDFARAYVVAHEVGHHVQTLTGLSQRVSTARQRATGAESNALSVRQELQADCYAGVWGHYAAQRGLLEAGDAEEGLRAAAAIGDDRLQRQTQGRVMPESFTHGSSADRVKWLRQGLESGRLEACETFQ
jgi:predicted metalloprotease